jgi:hypothetical protein
MVHCETGELYCWIFRSAGGKQAFRDLCRVYSPLRNTGKLPVVSLQTDKYNHPDYSWIDIPVLKVEDWQDQAEPPIAATPEPEIIPPKDTIKTAFNADMDDDIPF